MGNNKRWNCLIQKCTGNLADLAEKNQTVTLYAVWEDTHQFTIKFNSNGGSGSMSNQSALNNAEFKA